MTHQDRDHYLVHGEYHRGRCATSRQDVANVDHFGEARSLAAQISRNHDAKQALRSRRQKRFGRKSRFPVDSVSAFQRHGSGSFSSRMEIATRQPHVPHFGVIDGLGEARYEARARFLSRHDAEGSESCGYDVINDSFASPLLITLFWLIQRELPPSNVT